MLIKSHTTTPLQIFCELSMLFPGYFQKYQSSRRYLVEEPLRREWVNPFYAHNFKRIWIELVKFKNDCSILNPSNAEATFVQSTRTQRFLKISQTLSCWYSLESSRRVLSDEYPFSRVWVIFPGFSHNFVSPKLATSSIGVKPYIFPKCCFVCLCVRP